MSQVEVPEEIEHLDFEPEKEVILTHWQDPCNASIYWCGKTVNKVRNTLTFKDGKSRSAKEVDCVCCLRMSTIFGYNWWWRTHNTYHNSSCVPDGHNCGA